MDDGSAGATPAAPGGAGPAASGPLASSEWPGQVADLIEQVVGSVHDRVVRPLLLVARAVVFGILVGAMALVFAALISVAAVRILTVYVFDGRVWASDLLVGGLFTVVGLIAWSQRHVRQPGER
jgi:hypothetical protein